MKQKGIFQDLLNKSNSSKKEDKNAGESKYHQLLMIFSFIGLACYPFAIVGVLPLFLVRYIDKKDKMNHIHDVDYESFLKRSNFLFMVLAATFLLINLICFILWVPRAYLSAYLLFPLNMIPNNLTFSYRTVIALILGGLGMGSLFIALASFIDKRKVVSKEEEREKIYGSKAYQKRHQDKFVESQRFTKEYNRRYQQAIKKNDQLALQKLENEFLLGIDEFGLPAMMEFDEMNQHVLIPATTGSGKTTLLQLFVEHASKFDIPLILIDGKGAIETYENMQKMASRFGKDVKAFTDQGDMCFNPVKNGNDISVRDKLSSFAETESIYYTAASKALLQITTQLLDLFQDSHQLERSLPYMQKYLLPRNVLKLFADLILQKNSLLFTSIESNKKAEKSTMNQLEKELMSTIASEPDTEEERIDPETCSLLTFYQAIKKNQAYLSTEEQLLFERLFVRYEHKESPLYLYETSEALQTNINMLLDSELGRLFDTKDTDNILDVGEISRKGELVYVSLNGLIYEEFIRTLAQMVVGEVNYYASEMYRRNAKKKFLVIFDEPASYLNKSFIDLVNKGRGAGVYGIFTPQTMADIDAIGGKLKQQLIGNVNTYIIGKTNEKDEISYWAEMLGTYSDIDVTEVTEQEEGYADFGKTDWIGSKGTKRNVDRFKFHPNRIRELRTGEFVVYRTAKNVHEAPRAVYIRNPLAAD